MTGLDVSLRWEEGVLANELRVITSEDHAAPIAAVHLWYHVGSRHEPPHRRGFAHLFEHMMFRGTERLGPQDHFNLIRATGGECNAYTGFDQTVYVEEVPVHQLELVFWLESERMAFLRIDEDGLRTERNVIAEEYRVTAEAPYGTIIEQILPRVFPSHPYSFTPIGRMEDLARASPADLREFWQRHYVPANATIVVAGDVTHAQVMALAEKYFGWIPARPSPEASAPAGEIPRGPRVLRLKEPNGPAPIVALAYRTVPCRHADALPLELVSTLLGGGESSRLYRRLVTEKKVAVHALSGEVHLELDGVVVTAAVLHPLSRQARSTIALLREEIARFIDEGPAEKELLKVRNNALRDAAMSLLTANAKAQVLGESAVIEGDVSHANDRLSRIRSLEADDLVRAARSYLRPENEIAIHVVPSLFGFLWRRLLARVAPRARNHAIAPAVTGAVTAPPAGVAGDGAQSARNLARPAHLSATPVVAPIIPLPIFPLPRVTRLASGLRVAFLEERRAPRVIFQLAIANGATSEPASAPGTAAAAASLICEGTTLRSYEALADEIETFAIAVDATVGMDTGGVTVQAVRDEAARAMGLLAEVVRGPTFPEERLAMLRAAGRTAKAVAEKDAGYVADRTLRRQLYGEHPYARLPDGELADLARLSTSGMGDWWRRFVTPGNCTLYVGGDLTEGDALRLAERGFGDWRQANDAAPAKSHPAPAPPPAPPATTIHIVQRRGDQVQVRAGHLAIDIRDPRSPRAALLSQIFGGGFGSRLNTAMRVKRGWTYGARGGFSMRLLRGELTVASFTRVESAAEMVRAVIEEVTRLRAEPPTEEELRLARSYLLGSYALERETIEARFADDWLLVAAGLPADHQARWLAEVARVTPDDLHAAARELVHPEQLRIVVAGPERRLARELATVARVE